MLDWILSQFKRQSAEDIERAREMVRTAERDGTRANRESARETARRLGIEVAPDASAEQLVQAIRRYLARHGQA